MSFLNFHEILGTLLYLIGDGVIFRSFYFQLVVFFEEMEEILIEMALYDILCFFVVFVFFWLTDGFLRLFVAFCVFVAFCDFLWLFVAFCGSLWLFCFFQGRSYVVFRCV